MFSSNTYVIDDGRNAVIFDIGDFGPVRRYLASENLTLQALFITHTHYDHIYGIRELMAAFPEMPIYTSEFGKEAFKKPNWNFSRYHDDEISIESDAIKILNDGDILEILDSAMLEVMATPGHDKSCLSYKIGELLLTGDSYIPGVKVVASFPNSNKADAKYWYEKLESMSASHAILPGHGPIQSNSEINKHQLKTAK